MDDHPSISLNRVIIPLSLGTGLSLLGDSAIYTVLPTHTAEAGISLASLGILLSINRWVRLAANNGAGWLSERASRRRIFILSVLLGGLSTAMYAATTGFWPLLAGRVLWGIAWAGIWITGNAIALDAGALAGRGRTVGLYHTSFFLGAGLGAPIGGVLTDWLGYRPAMGVAAGLTIAGAALGWLFLPEISAPAQPSPPAGDPAATVADPPRHATGRRGELFSAIALQGVNRFIVAGLLISTFSYYLSQRFGQAVELAGRPVGITSLTGIALGAGSMLSVLSSPVSGVLSDRRGERWLVAALGLAAGAAGFLFLRGGSLFLVLAGLPLIFLASGSNQGLATALVGDTAPALRRGRILGLFYTVGDLTSAAGPLLAYWLIDRTGGANINYLLAAALSAAMGVLALVWWRRPAPALTG